MASFIATAGTDQGDLRSDSKIGIGKNPTAALDIDTSAVPIVFRRSGGIGSGELNIDNRMSGSSSDICYTPSPDSSGTGGHAFYADNGSSTNFAMGINKDGNVGIGTQSPQYKLHVEGSDTRILLRGTNNTCYATINAQNSDNDNLELVAYGRDVPEGSPYLGQNRGGGLFIGATPYIGDEYVHPVMGIGTRNGTPLVLGTNDEERVRLTADGKVGIGTEPTENVLLLEVSKSLTSIDDEYSENHAIKIAPSLNPHTNGYTLNAATIAPIFGNDYSDQTSKNCLNISPSEDSNFQKLKGINIYFPYGGSNTDAIFIDVPGTANGVNCACKGTGTAITGKAEGAGARGGYFEAANGNYLALQTGTGIVALGGNVGIGETSPGVNN